MDFFWKEPDINLGMSRFEKTPDAVLLDVRTRQEYVQGHIPNSKNIPLKDISKTNQLVSDLNTPLFVYCLSGTRSGQAVFALRRLGYRYVEDIGGLNCYNGQICKDAS